MPRYRICRAFTVESGHMLSKHPERCRYPHGHTRRIEIVVSADSLNSNDMVVDFKALKLAVSELVDRFDHSMAINKADPLRDAIATVHPDSIVEFDRDPTTEIMAETIFAGVARILHEGFAQEHYCIPAGVVKLESVRVWETPDSWAEFAE